MRSRRARLQQQRRNVEVLEPRRLLSSVAPVLGLDTGAGSNAATGLTQSNGLLYFLNRTSSNTNLYRSDGTAAGTFAVSPIGTGETVQSATAGELFYFTRGGDDLWRSDGSVTGTTLVMPMTTAFSRIHGLSDVGGALLFLEAANTASSTLRLWRSDGTTAGTTVVTQITESATNASDRPSLAVGGQLYFLADNLKQLWQSDGTPAGTSLVREFTSPVTNLSDVNGTLHFRSGTQLYKTDGTGAGTVAVADVSAWQTMLPNVGSKFYFTVGYELWRTDATTGDTLRVGFLGCGNRGQATYARGAGGLMFLGEWGGNVPGHELFVTDGSPNSFHMVTDINPVTNNTNGGFNGSFPDHFADVNGTLYFQANNGVNGSELYRTDGTPGGTALVADLAPGGANAGSSPARLTAVGNAGLFFTASSTANIYQQMWVCVTDEGAAPLGVRARAVSHARVDLSWGAAGSAVTAFKVQRSTDGVNYVDVARIDDPNARSYSDNTGLSPSSKYSYRVVAVRPDGSGGELASSPSNVSSATTQTASPVAPTGLAAAMVTGSSSQIRLTWVDSSGNEERFHVERRPAAAAPSVPFEEVGIAPENATEFTDTGLAGGTRYEFRVRAWNALGGFSGYSNVAAATTLAARAPFGPAPAAVPGTIQAEDFDLGGASIAYQDTTFGNTGLAYRVTDVDIQPVNDPAGGGVGYYIAAQAGDWVTYSIDATPPAGGSYVLEARVPTPANYAGGTFHLEHNGVNITGPVSVPSTPTGTSLITVAKGGITLPAGPGVLKLVVDGGNINFNWLRLVDGATVTVPASPAGVSALPVDGPAAHVGWSPVAGATGYWVERRTGPAGGAWTRLAFVPADQSRYAGAGLAPESPYAYRVVAVNGAGESLPSAEVEVTTLQAPANLVEDIVTRDAGSGPANFTRMGDAVYFTTHNGAKLWRTDGSDAGTTLLSDSLTSISGLTVSGNTLYFAASHPSTGLELYKTDGTAVGTAVAADVQPGTSSSAPLNITAFSTGVVFSTNGNQLLLFDGSSTQLLRQFTLGDPSFKNFTRSGNLLFFGARDTYTEGHAIWRTDGTAAGTIHLLTPAPHTGNFPHDFADVNGTLFFTAPTYPGHALFVSDGTVAGTKSISTGDFVVDGIVNFGGTAYLTVYPPRNPDGSLAPGVELWRSNGTPASTTKVTAVNVNSTGTGVGGVISQLGVAGGRLYFFDNVGPGPDEGFHLFSSDGTAAGTNYVVKLPKTRNRVAPTVPVELNGQAVFTTVNAYNASVLWRSDGTTAGTQQVGVVRGGDVAPAVLNGSMIVGVPDSLIGYELGRTDGTRAGTTLVKNLDTTPAAAPSALSLPLNLTDVGGTLYFTASPGLTSSPSTVGAYNSSLPAQLWRSDGTEAGTVPVTGAVVEPSNLFNLDGTLLFIAPVGMTLGLWRTDGTAGGTVLLADTGVSVPAAGSAPAVSAMVRAGGNVYFLAGTNQLWTTDGTAAGSRLVKVLPNGGAFEGVDLGNGTLAFTTLAVTGTNQDTVYLWMSDGTEGGTQQLAGPLVGTGTSTPTQRTYLASLNGAAYFRAGQGGAQRRLWRSDGTAAGTSTLTTLDPVHIRQSGARLYFYGIDYAGSAVGMYASDGTAGGTTLLRSGLGVTTFPTSNGSIADAPAGGAYFTSSVGTLYLTDGTAAGTAVVVTDPGMSALTSVGRTVYYYITNQLRGADGTPGYSRPVLVTPTVAGVSRSPIASGPSQLFVTASTAANGAELWRILRTADAPALTLAEADATHVRLDWTVPAAPPGLPISAFVVERRDGRAGDFAAVGTLPPGVTTFTDGGLDPAVGHEYRVRAINAGGPSPASNAVDRGETASPTASIQIISAGTGRPMNRAIIRFNESVTGFSRTDLILSRDGGANLLGVGQTVSAVGPSEYVLNNLTQLTSLPGSYQLTLSPVGVIDRWDNAMVTGTSVSWTHAPPPQVTRVFVGSTGWSTRFLDTLQQQSRGDARYGYAVDAADSLNELPWTNLNKISVQFNQAVSVDSADLAVAGVAVAGYGVTAFTYDAQSFTATWTLDTAGVAPEKLAVGLAGVTDAAGAVALDGEWPAVEGNAFPSGDGTAGGDFRFRLNVLPGDVNRSGGSVIGSDVTLVRNAQNVSPGSPGYSVFFDVNGSGSILGSDVTAVRNRQGLRLPTGEPSVTIQTVFSETAVRVAAPVLRTATSKPLEPLVSRAADLEALARVKNEAN